MHQNTAMQGDLLHGRLTDFFERRENQLHLAEGIFSYHLFQVQLTG